MVTFPSSRVVPTRTDAVVKTFAPQAIASTPLLPPPRAWIKFELFEAAVFLPRPCPGPWLSLVSRSKVTLCVHHRESNNQSSFMKHPTFRGDVPVTVHTCVPARILSISLDVTGAHLRLSPRK